jgi:superfamily II DNA or RNA helicase
MTEADLQLVFDASGIKELTAQIARLDASMAALIAEGNKAEKEIADIGTAAKKTAGEAEFMGIMSRTEMMAQFFIHDGGDTSKWRLKGHGTTRFWEWLATWSVCIRSPDDLGFDGSRYLLPPLQTYQHIVDAPFVPEYQLFSTVALTLNDRRAAKRVSMADRVKAAADLVNGNDDYWIVWCHLNAESEALTKAIPGSVEVTGSMSQAEKESRIMSFVNGESRVIVSKSSIMGFGLNLQHCARMVFVGGCAQQRAPQRPHLRWASQSR